MKNFDWTQFTQRIPVKASVQTLYNAWTQADEIEKWFLKKSVFSDHQKNAIPSSAYVQEGYYYAWQWYLFAETEYGKILEANGTNHLSFTFAGDCIVDIQLISLKDHTIVELTQKNIPTDDDSKKNIRLGCHNGWEFFLINLKSVYEGGLDLRNMDEDFVRMINN